ncbi:hypothetical protein E5288_WYG013695 [Bos mutus]|uniref:Uncharacterized protein n=1 Tax=Bos mutus TaxID=72004 RepID=A0A6B0QTQ4_9CETA|nr:hypothetical protein [Bos mutus]
MLAGPGDESITPPTTKTKPIPGSATSLLAFALWIPKTDLQEVGWSPGAPTTQGKLSAVSWEGLCGVKWKKQEIPYLLLADLCLLLRHQDRRISSRMALYWNARLFQSIDVGQYAGLGLYR